MFYNFYNKAIFYNKVILIGNLTRDGELKTLPSGQSILSLSLATNRTWVDKNGQKQEKPDFHNLIIWGKRAEALAPYLTKGKLILVEGRITTRTWIDKENKKQARTEIIVDNLQFGPNITGQSLREEQPTRGVANEAPAEEALPTIDAEDEESPFGDEDDEIPF